MLTCDNCKGTVVLPKKEKKSKDKNAPQPPKPTPEDVALEATFIDHMGDEKTHHFCCESCLNEFLNKRASKSKASLVLDAAEGTVEKVFKV